MSSTEPRRLVRNRFLFRYFHANLLRMDRIDKQIIKVLLGDGRISNVGLAELVQPHAGDFQRAVQSLKRV